MKMNNVDHRKQILLEEIERLRIELADLYKERDIVYDQIADQRRGKHEVVVEKNYYVKLIDGLMGLYSATKNMEKKAQQDFYKLTDKQAEQIKELSRKINSKLLELEEYNKKELIDIEGLNAEYDIKLKALLSEIHEAELRLIQIKKEADEVNKKTTKESQKLEDQREYQEKVKNNLLKREQKLNLKEKRLNKLHLELKSKKGAE